MVPCPSGKWIPEQIHVEWFLSVIDGKGRNFQWHERAKVRQMYPGSVANSARKRPVLLSKLLANRDSASGIFLRNMLSKSYGPVNDCVFQSFHSIINAIYPNAKQKRIGRGLSWWRRDFCHGKCNTEMAWQKSYKVFNIHLAWNFGSCLHFNSNAAICISGDSECHMKIHMSILVWDELKRRQNGWRSSIRCRYPSSREFSAKISEKRAMGRRKFIPSWLNIIGIWHSPIPMSAIGCCSFAGARKRWRFETQRKTARFSNSFQNRGSTRSIAECFSSRLGSDYRPCSINGHPCPDSSSSSGISSLEMGPPQIERESETIKATTCYFAAGRAWESTTEELDRVLPWWRILGILEEFF
jgi:hypothetical protein